MLPSITRQNEGARHDPRGGQRRPDAMNLIAKLLAPADVLADADFGSKKRVFEQVGLLLENNHQLARSAIFDSLFAREKLGSTGLGQGVAIPHGRLKGLREACIALVRLSEGIPFDAPDGQPVRLVFVLLVPDRATDLHLQILSELAQMLSDAAFREQLLAAPDAAALHSLVTHWMPDAEGQRNPAV